MGIISALKSAAKFVGKPIAKVLPSKATVKGIASKLGASKIKSVFAGAGAAIAASKVGSIFGSKAGKVGLAVAGGAALIGGSIFLYNKLSGNKDADKTEPNVIPDEDVTVVEKEISDEDKIPPKKTEPNDDNGKVPPSEVPNDKGKTEPNKVPDDNDKTEPNKMPDEEKYHTVVKGDNVWNIAKAHLKEIHKDDANYKPTNAEILKHTKELMAANKLHYEADNYRVLIRPGDKLKLTA